MDCASPNVLESARTRGKGVLLEKKLSAFSLQFEMVSGMSNAPMKSADVWKQPFVPLPWRTNQTRQESTGNAHCG